MISWNMLTCSKLGLPPESVEYLLILSYLVDGPEAITRWGRGDLVGRQKVLGHLRDYIPTVAWDEARCVLDFYRDSSERMLLQNLADSYNEIRLTKFEFQTRAFYPLRFSAGKRLIEVCLHYDVKVCRVGEEMPLAVVNEGKSCQRLLSIMECL